MRLTAMGRMSKIALQQNIPWPCARCLLYLQHPRLRTDWVPVKPCDDWWWSDGGIRRVACGIYFLARIGCRPNPATSGGGAMACTSSPGLGAGQPLLMRLGVALYACAWGGRWKQKKKKTKPGWQLQKSIGGQKTTKKKSRVGNCKRALVAKTKKTNKINKTK